LEKISGVRDSLKTEIHYATALSNQVGLFEDAEVGQDKKIKPQMRLHARHVQQRLSEQQIIAVLKLPFLSHKRKETNKGVWWMPWQ
jgi:hypothetical protein